MRTWLLPALLAGLTACAAAPAAEPAAAPSMRPQALDPVGTYDFTTTVEGTSVNGTLTITRSGSTYAGTVSSSVTDAMPVRTVTVEGNRVNVVADTPDGPLALLMEFNGDEFSGTWSLGTLSGTHTGRRRTP